jgi:type VI secretion system protein ImpE
MGAKELFDAGNLAGAIEQVTQDVKANPRDVKSRIFLFEMLCFAGELQRAERQLDAVAQTSGDVKVEIGVELYRSALKAEGARRSFFTGASRTPKFFAEPPAYTALHIEAAAKLHANQLDEMEKLLDDSAEARRPVPGQCADKVFGDFHDGDDLLSPILEAFFQGDYYWLPLEQVSRIDIAAPRTLRDLLWTPTKVELPNHPAGDVLIPAQYYGSHSHADDLIKLGRMTDWKSVGNGTLLGVGQRTFYGDDIEYPFLEIRAIEFTSSS